MSIEISDEDFEVIYAALRRVTEPYSEEEIPEVVRMERQAWKAIAKYRPQFQVMDE